MGSTFLLPIVVMLYIGFLDMSLNNSVTLVSGVNGKNIVFQIFFMVCKSFLTQTQSLAYHIVS